MKKDPLVYLKHNLTCINKIQTYTDGFNEQKFLANSLIQDGVIRNLEIIGEATKQLNQEFRSRYEDIPWKRIAGLRDKLIHDYIGVDMWAVWGVVEKVIPDFEVQIRRIILKEQGHE
jgi:uncharacterized protein with HEPN domain